MPTYEYACSSCGEHLEVVQSFKDVPLTSCPACGGSLRKVFSPIGVVFKGSGFYKTDSRSSGASSKPAANAGSDGSAAPAGGSSDSASPASSSGSSAASTSGTGTGTSSPGSAGSKVAAAS